ncbi:MAG: hypothetical protein KI793_08665 [Rivularia sp. (in: Bacteria)]|nr:hypothetical protein [Rivularia sp. MS3]
MVQHMKRDINTGTANEHYDLISVIYHSLQNAAACNMYIQDANDSGDRELMEFFQQVKAQSSEQAEQAKKLMAQRMGQQ